MGPSLQHVGKHQQEIEKLFRGSMRYDGEAPNFSLPLVLMAFTNRCGSMVLGEYLRLTGNFAGFHEHLNAFSVKTMLDTTGAVTFPDHVSSVVSQHKRNAAAFGFKASWDQILMLLRWRIDKMFTSLHVIHIERLDLVAQAVSFSIADQSKRWTSNQSDSGLEPQYNAADIRNRLDGIGTGNKLIRQICSVYALDFHQTKYENLISEPVLELNRIHNWLGIPLKQVDLGKARLKKQGDERNIEFIRRFRAEELAGLKGKAEPVEA